MKLKIFPFQKLSKMEAEKLKSFCENGRIGKNEAALFEENENSYLVEFSKPCTEEFFEKVFDPFGPFWDVYSEIGFALRPVGRNYAAFICGRLYFLKNIENSFMRTLSPEKSLKIKSGKLVEAEKLNLTNFLLALALPFDAAKRILGTIQLGFLANEKIGSFEAFRKKTVKYCDFYAAESNIANPVKIAKESLGLAVQSMAYSNLALLSYVLKVKLRDSRVIQNCESEQLKKLAERREFDLIRKLFGFYSLAPYDISLPRFRESVLDLEMYGAPESPINYFLKWRENAKFLAARYLDIERLSCLKLGKITNLNNLIFYLKTSEFDGVDFRNKKEIIKLKILAENRRMIFERCRNIELPPRIVCQDGVVYKAEEIVELEASKKIIKAVSVSKEKVVVGPAININSLDDYKKFAKGSIIVSKGLSPNLVILYGKALGVVSESGGSLAHAAIVAREMGLPCFLQAKLGRTIKDGQYVQLDGKAGKITVLDQMESEITKASEKKQADFSKCAEKFHTEDKKEEKNILMEEEGKEIFFLDEKLSTASVAGAKALNLSFLSRLYSVPSGFILAKGFFRRISQSSQMRSLNEQLLKTSPENVSEIENFSKMMKNIILAVSFSPDFESDLKYNLLKLSSQAVAVRSSSSCEDMPRISFAGQLDSYLNVKGLLELEDAIKKCWASFYNVRAIIYRKENGLENLDLNMSVIVQKMVESSYGGVMFTKNPNSFGTLLIEMVPGMCEDLVSGKAAPNSYALDPDGLSIVKAKVNFEFEDKKVQELGRLGLDIEKTFGGPQDIEWCIDREDKIWILQTRPITAVKGND